MTPTPLDTLRVAYETAASTPSDINEHLPTLVDLVTDNDAKTVIELGVRFGASTDALLYALALTGGHLWSVDIGNRYHSTAEHWTFLQGDDLSPEVLAQLPAEADLVFVDTDHRYRLTYSEIVTYQRRVKRGGHIVFHDTEIEVFDHHAPGTEPPFPVMKAINELLPASAFPRVHYENNNGLTVVTL